LALVGIFICIKLYFTKRALGLKRMLPHGQRIG
jgi:hypothetical protein